MLWKLVEFLEDESIASVPKLWIKKLKHNWVCYWPEKNVESLRRRIIQPPIKKNSKNFYKCRILLEGGELSRILLRSVILLKVRNVIFKRQPENVFFYNFDRGVQHVPRSPWTGIEVDNSCPKKKLQEAKFYRVSRKKWTAKSGNCTSWMIHTVETKFPENKILWIVCLHSLIEKTKPTTWYHKQNLRR